MYIEGVHQLPPVYMTSDLGHNGSLDGSSLQWRCSTESLCRTGTVGDLSEGGGGRCGGGSSEGGEGGKVDCGRVRWRGGGGGGCAGGAGAGGWEGGEGDGGEGMRRGGGECVRMDGRNLLLLLIKPRLFVLRQLPRVPPKPCDGLPTSMKDTRTRQREGENRSSEYDRTGNWRGRQKNMYSHVC